MGAATFPAVTVCVCIALLVVADGEVEFLVVSLLEADRTEQINEKCKSTIMEPRRIIKVDMANMLWNGSSRSPRMRLNQSTKASKRDKDSRRMRREWDATSNRPNYLPSALLRMLFAASF